MDEVWQRCILTKELDKKAVSKKKTNEGVAQDGKQQFIAGKEHEK